MSAQCSSPFLAERQKVNLVWLQLVALTEQQYNWLKWNKSSLFELVTDVRKTWYSGSFRPCFFSTVKPALTRLNELRLRLSDFKMGECIGRGACGIVRVVREVAPPHSVYAMKSQYKGAWLHHDPVSLVPFTWWLFYRILVLSSHSIIWSFRVISRVI